MEITMWVGSSRERGLEMGKLLVRSRRGEGWAAPGGLQVMEKFRYLPFSDCLEVALRWREASGSKGSVLFPKCPFVTDSWSLNPAVTTLGPNKLEACSRVVQPVAQGAQHKIVNLLKTL